MKSTDNIPQLRHLWRQCFHADNAFLDLFFDKGLKVSKTYAIEKDERIASVLTVFPIEHKGHPGGYVYGVCTDPSMRGHRYAISLLHELEEKYRAEGTLDFLILRPASGSLFDYYRKLGYDFDIFRHRTYLSLPLIPAKTEFKSLTAERLFQLRKRFFYKSGLIEWTTEVCSYILSFIKYSKGHAVEIMNGESYILSYPDPDNPGMIICEEAGITSSEDMFFPLSTMRMLYPDAGKVLLTLPQSDTKEKYLLCKPIKHLPNESAFFSFAME